MDILKDEKALQDGVAGELLHGKKKVLVHIYIRLTQ